MQGDRFCSADGGTQRGGGGRTQHPGVPAASILLYPQNAIGLHGDGLDSSSILGSFLPFMARHRDGNPPPTSHAGKSPPPLYTPPSFNQGSNEEHRKGLMPVHAWSLPGPGDKWPRDSNGQIRICIAVPSARSPRRAALLPNTRCKERSAGALHVNAWRWGGGSGGGGVIGRVWGEVGVVAKKNDGKKNKRGGEMERNGAFVSRWRFVP